MWKGRCYYSVSLAAIMFLYLYGCDWPLNNPYDRNLCDPECSDTELCFDQRCVRCVNNYFQGITCKKLGYEGGTLKCAKDGKFDTTGCYKCGDGKIDPGEYCDGKDLNKKSCKIAGYYGGTLKCSEKCTFDDSGCFKCGDGVINGSEKCDGSQVGSETCKTQGFDGGVLKCQSNCSFDTSSCYKCGDGTINGSEKCDGTQLGDKTCKTQGFDSGSLTCKKDCTIDTSGCGKCSDGIINGTEQCDGSKIGGKTCVTKGFDNGTLTCKSNCTIDTSGCYKLIAHAWSKGFGSTGTDYSESVAIDSIGNVYVTGAFYGTMDFGGGNITSKGGDDVFVASYTSSGVHRWSKAFGNAGNNHSFGVDVDSSGNVYVTGYFTGTVDFGGGNIKGKPSGGLFIASYTSLGVHRWSKGFGGTMYGESVAVDSSGNVYVIGQFQGTAHYGGGNITSKGVWDIFVASYTSLGVHRWSKGFGGTSGDIGYGVAVDSSGNVYFTGYFTGTVNFGGGNITSKGSSDLFVASYTSLGVHRWSKSFGGTSSDMGRSVTVDSSGNVYFTGYFTGTVDFGGGNITSKGDSDIFVTSYTSLGVHRWSKSFGGTSGDIGYGVAVDSSGNVYITGHFMDTVDFGGGKFISKGIWDIFVIKYTSSGAHQWSREFGSKTNDNGSSVTVDSSGNVYVTGFFTGTVDFGGGNIKFKGGKDIFLLKLASP